MSIQLDRSVRRGRGLALIWLALAAGGAGCAAEVMDDPGLEGEREFAATAQALGPTQTVATGFGRSPFSVNGNFAVFIQHSSNCSTTPFQVKRLRLSNGAVDSWNIGCRQAVDAAVAPDGTVHVGVGGNAGDPNRNDIITLTGAFPKRADTASAPRAMLANNSQIFWSDDVGLQSVWDDGTFPLTLLSNQWTASMGLDGDLIYFLRMTADKMGYEISEIWSNGLFYDQHFSILGTSPNDIAWDDNYFYYSFNHKIGAWSRWLAGFSTPYNAPAGTTLGRLLPHNGGLFFTRRTTATAKTDLFFRQADGIVLTQRNNIGEIGAYGLHVNGGYLYWFTSAGDVKKAQLN